MLFKMRFSQDRFVFSQVLLVVVADEPMTSSNAGIIRKVSLHHCPPLHRAILHHAPANRPAHPILTGPHAEVPQGYLEGVPVHDGGHAEEGGVGPVVREGEFEVAAVVGLLPLELGVGVDDDGGLVGRVGDGDVLAVGGGGGDGRAGEFDADGAGAGGWVLGGKGVVLVSGYMLACLLGRSGMVGRACRIFPLFCLIFFFFLGYRSGLRRVCCPTRRGRSPSSGGCHQRS